MARKTAAWQRLVAEGWMTSREEAERWILSGKVRVGNQPVTSAGQLLKDTDILHVRGIDQRYVSKGGLKLEGALLDFGIDLRGRVCIDAGASTGGFTDCLVQHGAKLVYAVDVGFGQLAGSLRIHPNVVNLEKTNIGDSSLLALSPAPTLGTVDLSYLSLEKAVPHFAQILHGTGDLLCLVKPLFEIDDAEARRSGVVPVDAYVPLLTSLADTLTQGNITLLGITHSPVTGNNGTLEFFLHLSLDGLPGLSHTAALQAAQAATHAAQTLPAYHKS